MEIAQSHNHTFKLDSFCWLMILAGALHGYQVNLIGLLHASEIVLPLIATVLLITQGSKGLFNDKFFQLILFMQIISLFGLAVCDLIVDSAFERYMRGWARFVFLISNTIALFIIVQKDKKYLWAFIMGIGVGLLIAAIIAGKPITKWKFGYGEPIALIALCLACCIPLRLFSVLILALGVFSIVMDYRNLGAALIITGIITLTKTNSKTIRREKKKRGQIIKLGIFGAIGALIIAAVVLQTNDLYERRADSNNGRWAAIVVATKAILESPVLGYGSWTQNEKFARMLVEEIGENFDLKRQMDFEELVISAGDIEGFYPHSQILQVWVEGGVVGAAFFLFLLYILIKYLRFLFIERNYDYLLPVFLYFLILSLWDWIASPFAGDTRLKIAVALAIIYVLYRERSHETLDRDNSTPQSIHTELAPKPVPYSVLQRKQDKA